MIKVQNLYIAVFCSLLSCLLRSASFFVDLNQTSVTKLMHSYSIVASSWPPLALYVSLMGVDQTLYVSLMGVDQTEVS